uniref:RNA-directed DNA polymerase, eukaryota, reverse transcriptase zinc-binding domain protein n=2 Tax=Tanacetum cinerariifolium TaxID=118510 RepID=A0A699L8W6_TANCI|nr:hypothetical protein [Tanacetum cinerariifolium]
MLDSYTSNMCFSSWGKNMNGKGHTLATVDIEYEWTTPRCSTCLIFDHVDDKCPKRPKVDAPTKDTDDGFVEANAQGDTTKKTDNAQNHSVTGWNHNEVDVAVINLNDQCIHGFGLKGNEMSFFVLLFTHIIGDFNSTLFLEDFMSSSSSFNKSMSEFKECVEEIKVRIAQRSSLQFTLSQKPKGKYGLLKKIDRIMANVDFNDVFMGAHAIFKPYQVSNHLPYILTIPALVKQNLRPFKFFNVVIRNERFKHVMQDGWAKQFSGYFMFKVVQRLKYLKKPLRKLLYDKGNFHTNVTRLRDDLDMAQICLDADPFKVTLRENEATIVVAFNDALIMEERFLKQKAKIDWLQEGDSNLAYFQKPDKRRSEFPI